LSAGIPAERQGGSVMSRAISAWVAARDQLS